MKYCGIYQIKNEVTGKIYIGQSNDINRRWNEHKTRAFDPNNNCYHKPLYLSMRKHGLEVFTMTIIEECSQEQLNEREAYYIKLYNCLSPNGYNVSEQPMQSIQKITYCKECGAIIGNNTRTGLCHSCYSKLTRKCIWPTKEELYELLQHNNFCAVGRIYMAWIVMQYVNGVVNMVFLAMPKIINKLF